jgi:hypothetical protein
MFYTIGKRDQCGIYIGVKILELTSLTLQLKNKTMHLIRYIKSTPLGLWRASTST